MNINLDSWAERINNLLEIQKETQQEIMTVRFSRRELIELRMIVNSLDDYLPDEEDN